MRSSARRQTATVLPPMERRVRQAWLVLHIVSSVGWLGVVLAALALCVAGLANDDPEFVHAVFSVMVVLADTYFLPGTVLVLVSGLLLGLGTTWGLFRFYWVAVKLCIGVVLFLGSVFVLQLAVERAAQESAALRPLPAEVDVRLFGMLCVTAALAVAATVLSVMKPWGRITWR
jgi:Predicted integral membrane protein (DUF2269)